MVEHVTQSLIILHGWDSTRALWEPFIAQAQETFDVHFIALPCFDNVPCPDRVWDIHDYAQYVYSKLDTARLTSNIVLLGHSFGGQIAIQLAHEHPELAQSLVLVGAAVVRPRYSIKRVLMVPFVWGAHILSYIPGVGALLQRVRPLVYRALGGHDYLHTNGIKKEIYKTITQQDLTHFLPTIQTPALVLWGAHDTYTPLRYGKKIASLLPRNQLVVFDDGKHGLHHTHAAPMLAAIRDFVSR